MSRRSSAPARLRHFFGMPNSFGKVLLQECSSFKQYFTWQPRPRLHHVVYGHSIAAYRALARCGHHPFADGRAARHRVPSTAWTNSPCRFCACGVDSVAHAVLECPAHNILRQRWANRSRHALSDNYLYMCSQQMKMSTRAVTSKTTLTSLLTCALQPKLVRCEFLFSERG